jgi:hypothetical protein
MRAGILVLLLVPWLAHAQGQFVLNNYVPPTIDAPFATGPPPFYTGLIGADFQVFLRGAPAGSSILSSTPTQPPNAGIQPDNPGYVIPVTISVPGVPAGAAADIWMAFGSSYQGGSFPGTGGPWRVTLGGNGAPLPFLPLGTSPIVQLLPEPSPFALGLCAFSLFGIAARYRRQSHRSLNPPIGPSPNADGTSLLPPACTAYESVAKWRQFSRIKNVANGPVQAPGICECR